MKQQLIDHPIRSLGSVLVAAFAFFMLSASGEPGTYWSDGPGWLGAIGWFTFLALALVFIGSAVTIVVSRVRRRTA